MRHPLALLALLSSLAALPAVGGIDTGQYENKVVGYANGKPLYVKVNPKPGNRGQSGDSGKAGNQGHGSMGQQKPAPQVNPQHQSHSQSQPQWQGASKGGTRPVKMSRRVNCGPSCQSYGWSGSNGGWNSESGNAWSGDFGSGYPSGFVAGSSYLDGYSYGYTPQQSRCLSGPSNSSHGRWSGYLNYGSGGGYGWAGKSCSPCRVPQRVFGPGFVHPFPAAAAAGYSSIPRYGHVTGIPRYAP